MKTDKDLILDVKGLKAYYNVSYKAVAEVLGIKQKSFYNWIAGDYQLSDSNKIKLERFIKEVKE